MSDTEAAFADVTAILKIDGEDVQISAVQTNFALNKIPVCTCILAGVEDDNFKKIQFGNPAQVTVTLTDDDGTSETITLFDGYVMSFSPARTATSISYTLTLIHWLTDLNRSSLGTHQFTKATPFNPIDPFSTEAYGAAGPNALSILDKLDLDTSDFWTAIKESIIDIAGTSSLTSDANNVLDALDTPGQRQSQSAQDNYKADVEAALDKFDGTLSFVIDEPEIDNIKRSIEENIASTLFGFNAHTAAGGGSARNNMTAWNAIISLAKRFHFYIAPAVECVYVAPVVPNLKSDYFEDDELNSIMPSEFWELSVQNLSGTFLRGVVVVGGNYSSAWNVSNQSQFVLNGPIGEFVPKQKGALHIVPAPFWLQQQPVKVTKQVTKESLNSCASEVDPSDTPEKSQVEALAENTEEPELAALGPGGASPVVDPRDDIEVVDGGSTNFKVVMPSQQRLSVPMLGPGAAPEPAKANRTADKYAKMVYMDMVLAGRHVKLTGKLRVDKGPGTPVSIGLPGKVKAGFGTIGSVTVTVDCTRAIAQTSYDIYGYRTFDEDKEAAVCFDSHPLFNDVYLGKPLWPAEKTSPLAPLSLTLDLDALSAGVGSIA